MDNTLHALKQKIKQLAKSLKHKLLSQNNMGQPKHQAKLMARQEYLEEHGDLKGYNPAKVDGIYSRGTMTTYINCMGPFIIFCVQHGACRLSDLTEAMAEAYLRAVDAAGKSAWTISTYASAINKALGYHLYPSRLGLKRRRKEDIIRSRRPHKYGKRLLAANLDCMTLTEGAGPRRMSSTAVTPRQFVRNSQQIVIGVWLREKGGRTRLAPILNDYRDRITAIVDNAIAQHGMDAPLFTKYSRRIDNHRLRAAYCAALLHQLEAERQAGLPLFGGAFNLDDYCHLRGRDTKRKPQTAGHDTDLLGAVSGALGHNRVEVILRYYLYLY